MGQDLPLELLQLRTGVEAELVGQAVTNPLVGGQGIGLAAFPVQRGDQQHPKALLEGMRGDRSFQLADHITCLAQLRTGREPGLDELHPGLFEPGPVWREPITVAGAREDVAAEHRQRRHAQVGRATLVAGLEQADRRTRVPQHGECVDSGRIDDERVAAVAADEQGWIAERTAELGDLRLERVPARADSIGPPQVVDEPVGSHQDHRRRARAAPTTPTSSRPEPARARLSV